MRGIGAHADHDPLQELIVYKSILIPTDGSALSRKAVKNAIQLAKEQDARVVGLHVTPPYQLNVHADYVPPGFVSPQEYAAQAKKTATRYLDVVRKAAQEAGVACTCACATSAFPYREIINAARRNRCDLIFMASHGRRGISRLLLGSETSKVLSHSKIPVLVHR
jgi:nucleotide-binding universal stress UspA family protein